MYSSYNIVLIYIMVDIISMGIGKFGKATI